MLLPSALSFDALYHSRRSASTTTSPPTSPGGFVALASCRALQAVLGSRPASPFSLILPNAPRPTKEKPVTPTRSERRPQRTPLLSSKQNIKVPKRARTQSQMTDTVAESRRSSNKRTRADFEAADKNNASTTTSNSANPNHILYPSGSSTTTTTPTIYQPDQDSYSTPKRQRRVPLQMPLGLSADDFEGLDPTPKSEPRARKEAIEEAVDLPDNPGAAEDAIADESGWSAADDRMLVSTVLDKLNLSRRDWNDCGRRMENDRDSLGKRWRVLVRNGEAALRRGSGGRSRPELREDWKDDRTM